MENAETEKCFGPHDTKMHILSPLTWMQNGCNVERIMKRKPARAEMCFTANKNIHTKWSFIALLQQRYGKGRFCSTDEEDVLYGVGANVANNGNIFCNHTSKSDGCREQKREASLFHQWDWRLAIWSFREGGSDEREYMSGRGEKRLDTEKTCFPVRKKE